MRVEDRRVAVWALSLCFVFGLFGQEFLMSPDFWRIIGSIGHFQSLEGSIICIPLSDGFDMPRSPLAAIGFVLGRGFFLLGSPCFPLFAWYLTLCAIYWAGVLCVARASSSNYALFLVSFSAIFVSCSFFLKSYYEEAIIIVLVPWVILSISSFDKFPFRVLFVFLVAMMAWSKTQAIIGILFIFLMILFIEVIIRKKVLGVSHFIIYTLAVAAVCLVALERSDKMGFSHINEYHRYFNGFGWVSNGVSSWPVSEHQARFSFFHANENDLLKDPHSIFPDLLRPMIGSHAWSEKVTGASSNQKQALEDFLASTSVQKLLLSNQTLFFDFFLESVSTGLKADYRLDNYINVGGEFSFIDNARRLSQVVLVPMLIIGSLLCLSTSPLHSAFSLFFIFLSFPLVVLADGFFEFERHLWTQFFFVPMILLPPFVARKEVSLAFPYKID